MENQDFTVGITVDETPSAVFNAITDVRGWWSEGIKGNSEQVNDVFDYQYQDMHRCKMKLVEVIPGKRIVWHVLENYFNFTQDEKEWVDTHVIFEITPEGNQTHLQVTHQGLVPEYECYNACVGGWTQYITQSLPRLITTGKGLPNAKQAYTTHEVAGRFHELAQQEKWFEIQDELFAEDVISIDPANSPYMKNAEGRTAVRLKGQEFVSRIEAAHRMNTSQPVIAGNHFAVSREMDITVKGHGRIQLNEIMLYEVKDGKIISEQFFY